MKVLSEVLQAIEDERGRSGGLDALVSALGMPPISEWILDEEGFYYFDRDSMPGSRAHWRDEL